MSEEPKKLFIETVGCQMNMLDSEMVVASLRSRGYVLVDDPKQADALLFNTCSVREHAEEKTYSSLGTFRQQKERHPHKIIGVMGCMAQKDQGLIFQRAPYVDFVVGPGQLSQIPDLIDRAQSGTTRQLAVGLDRQGGSLDQIKRSHETFDPLRDPEMRPTPTKHICGFKSAATNFALIVWFPIRVVPNRVGPLSKFLPRHTSWPSKAVKSSFCWAKR